MSNTFQCMAKPENTLFTVQVMAIFVSVVAAILNISFQTGNLEVWTMLLVSSMGYLMPNPQFKPLAGEKVKDNEQKKLVIPSV